MVRRYISTSNPAPGSYTILLSLPILTSQKTELNVLVNMASTTRYCTRCQKSFCSSEARQQHIRDSPNHNVCHHCFSPPDYATEDESDDHLEEVHYICIPCDKQFEASSQLTQHDVAKHHMCMTCRRYFNNSKNRSSVCYLVFFVRKIPF